MISFVLSFIYPVLQLIFYPASSILFVGSLWGLVKNYYYRTLSASLYSASTLNIFTRIYRNNDESEFLYDVIKSVHEKESGKMLRVLLIGGDDGTIITRLFGKAKKKSNEQVETTDNRPLVEALKILDQSDAYLEYVKSSKVEKEDGGCSGLVQLAGLTTFLLVKNENESNQQKETNSSVTQENYDLVIFNCILNQFRSDPEKKDFLNQVFQKVGCKYLTIITDNYEHLDNVTQVAKLRGNYFVVSKKQLMDLGRMFIKSDANRTNECEYVESKNHSKSACITRIEV